MRIRTLESVCLGTLCVIMFVKMLGWMEVFFESVLSCITEMEWMGWINAFECSNLPLVLLVLLVVLVRKLRRHNHDEHQAKLGRIWLATTILYSGIILGVHGLVTLAHVTTSFIEGFTNDPTRAPKLHLIPVEILMHWRFVYSVLKLVVLVLVIRKCKPIAAFMIRTEDSPSVKQILHGLRQRGNPANAS